MTTEKTNPTTSAEETAAPAAEKPEVEEKKPKKDKKSKKSKDELQLENLQKELDASKDQYLRLVAEYDNFRKRTAKEKDSIYANAKVDTLGALLPVLDNFERALSTEAASAEDLKKGMDMIFNQFTDMLEKSGVTAFGEEGEAFDPNIHNAVMHEENPDLGESVVAQVFQKGYKVGDEHILRHAMVKVAN